MARGCHSGFSTGRKGAQKKTRSTNHEQKWVAGGGGRGGARAEYQQRGVRVSVDVEKLCGD